MAKWDFDSIAVDSRGDAYFIDASGHGNNLYIVAPAPYNQLLQGDSYDKAAVLSRTDLRVRMHHPLPYNNMTKAWEITANVRCDLTATEQVFICKAGERGAFSGDLSIGYDNSTRQYFLEVADAEGNPVRIFPGVIAEPGIWYRLTASGTYLSEDKSEICISVAGVDGSGDTAVGCGTLNGYPLRRRAGEWIVGHGYPYGFPNSLAVLGGAIDDITISGEGLPYTPGDNPIFQDCFTADPAVTIVDGVAYAYVGEDCATSGGWFSMPHWLCYTSSDMKNWTPHGPILKAADFPYANPSGAWAAQMVERDGRFYFYVTLDDKSNGKHTIDVAVADNPLGPFVPARPDGSPLITDDMTTDSHRLNADIDPTVLIDDDGTAWIAWGNGDCYIARLKNNMIELDGDIIHLGMRNYSEGPWLFKRDGLYYNVYAADAPGVQPEQIAYSTATSITGPWTYRGLITGPANYGFTIHPSVVELDGKWYFFYHDGAYDLDGQPGGDCRRRVCLAPLFFGPDGSILPINLK